MRIRGKSLVLFLALVFVLSSANTAFCGDIILNDLESKPVNLSSLTGKPAILFFWTTWCPYCRTELKELNKMYPQMEKEGIAVFAVNVGEESYKVVRFLKDHPLNIRVLLDRDTRAAENYEINGVPTYIFMNKSGKVISLEHRLPADYKNLLLNN
ncbi:MAG: TlpA disulfide reductase family protein [Candidatus Omnitrophota bacterium]|jgi:peroxiredoxin